MLINSQASTKIIQGTIRMEGPVINGTTTRPSPWGRIPPYHKEDRTVSSSHSPKDSTVHIHRMTPKQIDTTEPTDAVKKRKWNVGPTMTTSTTAHVTPNPNTSPMPEAGGLCTIHTSQKKTKKNRKLSLDGETASAAGGVMVQEEIFPKLDTSDPDSARRVQQRRRTIAMGKNTVGYDEYRKQVPVHQRKPRSMNHPATPDHSLDIPNRRWLGLVKAWRVALHQFDPPEMKDAHKMLNESTSSSSCSGNSPMQVESPMLGEMIKKQKNMSLQEEEMERAKNQGLPVDFNILTFHTNTPCAAPTATNTAVVVSQEESQETQKKIRRVLFTEDEDDDDDEEKIAESQVPVVSSRGKKGGVYYWPYGGEDTKNKKVEDELDRWEKQAPEEDDLLVDYEDSDDDLL